MMDTRYAESTVERPAYQIKCCYCHYLFTPEPIIKRNGKRRTAYIECPRCGNGIERPARRYDYKKAVPVNG